MTRLAGEGGGGWGKRCANIRQGMLGGREEAFFWRSLEKGVGFANRGVDCRCSK